jgi:hypothetical protein
MWTQVVIPILYAIVFTAIVYRWRFFRIANIEHKWVALAFVIKLLAGVALWWVYAFHYNGADESDALRYFNDANIIKQQWDENREVFWSLMLGKEDTSNAYQSIYDKLVGWHSGYRYGLTNDCQTIIRLNVVIGFVAFGSYHVHWMFMSFIAFMGFAALYKAFQNYFTQKHIWLFIACFMLPSVVFWSAGLLKEGPTMLGVGFLFWGLKLWTENHKNWITYFIIAMSCALLAAIKEYVLFSILPGCIFLIVVKLSGSGKIILKFVATQILCFVVAQNAHHFFIGGDFLYVLNKKKTDFYNTSALRNAQSTIYIPDTTTPASFALHYPQAFSLSYLRPYMWEIKSWMYALFAVENLVYALMLLATIFFFKKPNENSLPMLLTALSFALVLASIIGNCVPVLGSIVRYKIATLPLLVIFCFACIDFEKIKRIIRSA